MATVEELRKGVVNLVTIPSMFSHDPVDTEAVGLVDSLIAAAEEEGCEDGWVATKMLWQRMQKWNEEWQKENPKERSMTLLDAMDLIEWKIAAAREEGAKQERERIVCGSQRFPKGEYVVDSDYISMVFSPDGIGEAMTDCELFIIPASVLAPAPKEESK